MITSLKNIDELPSINTVIKSSRAFAILDAILEPEWEYRNFSYNKNWDVVNNEMMASMKDGTGCEYFIHISEIGVAGKVFDKEINIDSLSNLRFVPETFTSFKKEPAFSLQFATYFFWRGIKDSEWKSSPNNLENYSFLGFITGGIDNYLTWAESYYEREVDKQTVQNIYSSLTITQEQISILNPKLTMEDLKKDLSEII